MLEATINKTHNIVLNLLQNFPALRDNDDLLYAEVIESRGFGSFPASELMKKRSTLNLPPYETVRRARAKIQSEHPELRGKNYGKRREAEDIYLDYVKGKT